MKYLLLITLSTILVQACSTIKSNQTIMPTKTPETSAKTSLPSLHPDYLAYKTLCESSLEKSTALLNTILEYQGAKTIATILEPLNEIDILMDSAWNKAAVYANAHPEKSVRDLADTCSQKFSQFYTELGLSKPLYEAVSSINLDSADTDTRRVVELLLQDFRRAGVDKDPTTREKIRALNEELTIIEQEFDNNINNSVRFIELDSVAELDGLPKDYIEAHPPNETGKIIITTNYPDYQPFMRYATNDKRRKQLMREFLNRAYPENEPVLKSMLEKRYELARLLGYQNYAEYITENKMIKTPGNADAFIQQVSESAQVAYDRENQLLLTRLRQIDPDANIVNGWQTSYLLELLRKEKYALDSKELREYFHYQHARDGIFNLISRLFGVEIKSANMPSWHEDVETYEIWENNTVIARFYLDMHPRDGKYKHAAEYSLISGIKGRQIPEAALLCNFPDGLMEHSQVEVFLHEFGHLIHQLFAVSDHWVALSGIRNETDFVEAPSQMLEEWVWDADTLKTFAINDKNQIIPDALIEKIQAARYFGKGIGTRRQMMFAGLSLNFYNRKPDFELSTLAQEIIQKHYPYDNIENTYFYVNFGHLGGYSAVYYTYMWSKVIALDMFSRFEEHGITNPIIAGRYRNKILAPGPKKDAADLVQDFLGRPYNFEAFKRFMGREK